MNNTLQPAEPVGQLRNHAHPAGRPQVSDYTQRQHIGPSIIMDLGGSRLSVVTIEGFTAAQKIPHRISA
jgi:hypothetical protein